MSFVLSLKNLLPGTVTNEWLMTQYRLSQEAKYLTQLYNNCANDLYHFLLTMSAPALAEDITQRTWLKVIDNRNKYQVDGTFTGWLFTIGRRLLIDELRKQNRWVELEEATLADAQTTIESGNRSLMRDFDSTLSQLPFLQREAFILRQEGFGIQEICHITSSNTEAVKSRLRYAKNSLRQALGKYHD